MFQHAIVRTPGRSLVDGISTAGLGKPDYRLALAQHRSYVHALQDCGLEVLVLPPAEDFPDSVFIEDAALCTPKGAVVTRPGADSRRGEADLLLPVLRRYFERIAHIEPPGHVDAGDVMMVGEHYYIGLSGRTDAAGAQQLLAILDGFGLGGSTVALSTMLHLKTGLSYLEQGRLLQAGEFRGHAAFAGLETLAVDDDEAYAANCVWINGQVLVPHGYPRTRQCVEALGYRTIALDVSEFRKLDGGLSCLSLRF